MTALAGCLARTSLLPPEVERAANLGWRMYPASRFSRAACFAGATDAATRDLDQLGRWAREYPDCNWRLVFEGSGVWGLDVDAPGGDHAHDGIAALTELVRTHGSLPQRPMTRSGGGGFALFFRYEGEEIIGDSGNPAPGIDPRRGRQSLTIPPSLHHRTRQPYRWITPPWVVAPPPAPDWLLRLLQPSPRPQVAFGAASSISADKGSQYAVGAARSAVRRVASAPEGCRNHTLNCEAYSLARFVKEGHLSERWLADSLLIAATTAGLDEATSRATIVSGLNGGLAR